MWVLRVPFHSPKTGSNYSGNLHFQFPDQICLVTPAKYVKDTLGIYKDCSLSIPVLVLGWVPQMSSYKTSDERLFIWFALIELMAKHIFLEFLVYFARGKFVLEKKLVISSSLTFTLILVVWPLTLFQGKTTPNHNFHQDEFVFSKTIRVHNS